MTKKVYLRIALPTPLRRLFDYLPPQSIDYKQLIPGIRVRVPFQSRSLIGILIEVAETTQVAEKKLKPALELLDQSPLFTSDIQQLCEWSAHYYHCALGEVMASAIPGLLRQGKKTELKETQDIAVEQTSAWPKLNDDQAKAVATITECLGKFQAFLLDGVTGSGKTEVYLEAIQKALQADKQVLVLLPEISLTPQTIKRFQERFAVRIATFHSGLSEQERLQAWLCAKQGLAKIIIGTRSAVFVPFANLGLIIVDEEHDGSFKQQDRFRYHARDVAVRRASFLQIPIVLGSATPSLESWWNVKRARYTYLVLPKRAGKAQLPNYQIVDLKQSQAQQGLSQDLLDSMHAHLEKNNQVLLFLNRRGFAPVLFCKECAWIATCRRCDARMVYHQSPKRLQCHHCDQQTKILAQCPSCQQNSLQPIGLGTERLEEALAVHFKDVPIIRVDRDTTRRKNSLQQLLTQIHTQDKAILLGTQMLAKGHHFPQVTLVGIIDADGGLFSADFRATEQMGQLILQIAGRAGRVEKLGTVMIQTRHPHHPLLQTLITNGYQAFAETLLTERQQAFLPPFSYFALLRAEAYTEEMARNFLSQFKEITRTFSSDIALLGPVAALMAKRKGLYCQHLLIRAENRSQLQHFLQKTLQHLDVQPISKSVKWALDVDPIEVM